MKAKLKLLAIGHLLTALSLSASAQGTAFTYQGRLNSGGIQVNGSYDLKFSLYSTNAGGSSVTGPVTNRAVVVTNGLFTTALDFGQGVFTGQSNWLEIAVATNPSGVFTTLAPRQQLTPTPYAVTAEGVVSGGVTTTMLASGAVTSDKIAAAAVKGFQIDDGGNAAYEKFLDSAQSVGGDKSLSFANLSPVVATNGIPPSFAFTLNGSTFGTVAGFSGVEGISQTYNYVVQVYYSGAAVNPDAQLGLAGRLTYTRNGRSTSFAGVCTACTLSASNNSSLLYTFRLEPSLAFMALTTDYQVNQNNTAPAVAALYLGNNGITASQILTASYTAHDNLIQYNETDLNFFSRILEYEGIFYFFNQSASPPSLILGDNTSAYQASPNSPFPYYGNLNANIPAGAETIQTFQKAYHQSTLTSVVSGYDFTHPAIVPSASSSGTEGINSNFEFGSSSIRTTLYNQFIAQVRQDRQTAARTAIAGSGTAPDLRAGYTFALSDQTSAGLGGSYLVTSIHHAGFVRVTNGVGTLFYGNQFQVVPASQIYRPPLTTPKPQAQPSTAVVTGTTGTEIFTDQYGRVKVQFKWDRYGNNDQTSSAWIRLASPWAGKYRGLIFLPRIGDEVLVSFVQGDPDQPVITGSLYNANNMPPYALPANQTQSGIRTLSSLGGTVNDANELRFEDKKGSEEIYLSATKLLTMVAHGSATLSSDSTIGLLTVGGVGINKNNPAGALDVAVASGQSLIFRQDSGLVPGLNVATTGGNAGIMRLRNAMEIWPSDDATRAGRLDVRNTSGNATISLDGASGVVTCVSLTQTSDRNAKENFAPVQPSEVLEKVAALPLSSWNYKADVSARHLGPMAQDFYSLFKLGTDEKHIAPIDEGGVALAAIQGLNEKVESGRQQAETRIEKLEVENAELKARLETVERLLENKAK